MHTKVPAWNITHTPTRYGRTKANFAGHTAEQAAEAFLKHCERQNEKGIEVINVEFDPSKQYIDLGPGPIDTRGD